MVKSRFLFTEGYRSTEDLGILPTSPLLLCALCLLFLGTGRLLAEPPTTLIWFDITHNGKGEGEKGKMWQRATSKIEGD